MKDAPLALKTTRYRILSLEYRRVAAILAEFEESEQVLRDALRIGHQIEITDEIAGAVVLHVVIDEQQTDKLREYRIPNPTLLQLIGTSRVISTSEKDAAARFEALMKGDDPGRYINSPSTPPIQ